MEAILVQRYLDALFMDATEVWLIQVSQHCKGNYCITCILLILARYSAIIKCNTIIYSNQIMEDDHENRAK
jgi:hypothetical protein